jgi:DNA-binding response OmpR family regulator
MPPPVIWIVDADHWPRALLRAELIERGYDAVGFVTVDDALRVMPERWPDAIIVELRYLTREEAARLFGAHVPVIAIADLTTEPWIDEFPWAAVLRRPVSIGEIAEKVAAFV